MVMTILPSTLAWALTLALVHMTMLSARAADTSAMDACSTQADLRRCLASAAVASAAELAQANRDAITAIAGWDEDARYRLAASAALRESQRSFEQYRAAQCAFAAALGGGAAGNALALRRLTCVSELNRVRAANLRKQINDLPAIGQHDGSFWMNKDTP